MIGWILRAFVVGGLFLAFHGVQSLLGSAVPWWGSLLAAAVTYFAVATALKTLFFKAVTAPFKAKGAPLRGARLVVHSLTAVAAPVREQKRALAMAGAGGGDDGGSDDDCDSAHDSMPETWRWYCIDATVTPPAMTDGPFRGWAPGELSVVSQDADTSPSAPTDDGVASIKGIEVFEDGAFTKDDGLSFEGEKRLRLTIACAPDLQAAKLRYYFEGFGCIELPKG